MKRFLALFLVLVLAFSVVLVSCKDNNTEDPEETSDDEEFEGIGDPDTTTTAPDATEPEATEPSGNTNTDFSWTDDTNGTMVYVRIDNLTVRTDTYISGSTYKGTVTFGQSFKRIKYNSTWTMIEFGGGQYYVSSEFITTDPGSVVFNTDAEPSTVYVNVEKTLNLRTSTYVNSDTNYDKNIAYILNRGAELTRIGISQNGNWVMVKFGDDQRVLYCNTDFVSTTLPSDETTSTPVVTGPTEG